jgi:hypothetical protein
MLSPDDLKAKIQALDDEAARHGGPDGARFRDLAMRWRLLEVEAVFMEAIRATLTDDGLPS